MLNYYFGCPLFYYLCGIRLINRLINENHHISEIIVDSFAQKIIIKDKRAVGVECLYSNKLINLKSNKEVK